MAARSKAQMVSLKQLAGAVDKAAQLAGNRPGVTIDKDTIIHRSEIIGRILTSATDLNDAFKVAQDISAGAKVPGLKPQPVATRIGKDILVGFIDRGNLLKTIK
jgi:hypothetical protein